MQLFNIGFVIFPDLTQLDFTGPLQVLSRLPQSAIHIVAKSEAPVPSDCGLSLVPTHTFANLSAPRFDLRPRRKLRCRANSRRSRNHRVRPPAGGCCEVGYLGLHRCIHSGCCWVTQRTSRSRGFPRLSGPGRAAWVGRDTRAREYLAERR